MNKFKKMFQSVPSKYGTYSVGATALVILIAIVVNLIAEQLPESMKSVDLSSTNIYEISEVSEELLEELDTEVSVKVIANLESMDTRIETFVKKYAALSDKIEVEWLDSVNHPTVLQEYDTDGDAIIVSCEETGKTMEISFYDIIQHDTYSYYMTGSLSETAFDGEGQLTSAINYVTNDVNKKIYRTNGHGESTFSTSINELFTKNNLETEEINLSMNAEIPEDCDLLFLYGPTSDITDDEKSLIQNYMKEGGNVYLVLGDTTKETPNLDDLMSAYGLEKVDGYIADLDRCYQNNYYAVFPELSLSDEQSKGISNEMVLVYNSLGMRQIETEDDSLSVSPFLTTTSNAFAVTEDGEEQGEYIFGAVATKTFTEEVKESDATEETETTEARFTVLASESMISADVTDQLTTLDNLTLFINTITENFDDVETVAVEAKSLEVEYNTPTYAGAFSLLVIFIIPAIILIIGFVTWMRRRKA